MKRQGWTITNTRVTQSTPCEGMDDPAFRVYNIPWPSSLSREDFDSGNEGVLVIEHCLETNLCKWYYQDISQYGYHLLSFYVKNSFQYIKHIKLRRHTLNQLVYHPNQPELLILALGNGDGGFNFSGELVVLNWVTEKRVSLLSQSVMIRRAFFMEKQILLDSVPKIELVLKFKATPSCYYEFAEGNHDEWYELTEKQYFTNIPDSIDLNSLPKTTSPLPKNPKNPESFFDYSEIGDPYEIHHKQQLQQELKKSGLPYEPCGIGWSITFHGENILCQARVNGLIDVWKRFGSQNNSWVHVHTIKNGNQVGIKVFSLKKVNGEDAVIVVGRDEKEKRMVCKVNPCTGEIIWEKKELDFFTVHMTSMGVLVGQNYGGWGYIYPDGRMSDVFEVDPSVRNFTNCVYNFCDEQSEAVLWHSGTNHSSIMMKLDVNSNSIVKLFEYTIPHNQTHTTSNGILVEDHIGHGIITNLHVINRNKQILFQGKGYSGSRSEEKYYIVRHDFNGNLIWQVEVNEYIADFGIVTTPSAIVYVSPSGWFGLLDIVSGEHIYKERIQIQGLNIGLCGLRCLQQTNEIAVTSLSGDIFVFKVEVASLFDQCVQVLKGVVKDGLRNDDTRLRGVYDHIIVTTQAMLPKDILSKIFEDSNNNAELKKTGETQTSKSIKKEPKQKREKQTKSKIQKTKSSTCGDSHEQKKHHKKHKTSTEMDSTSSSESSSKKYISTKKKPHRHPKKHKYTSSSSQSSESKKPHKHPKKHKHTSSSSSQSSSQSSSPKYNKHKHKKNKHT